MTPSEILRAPPESRFGKFVTVQKLGTGGMGEVWKAWDTGLSRWVALKLLKGSSEEEEARFLREAQTAASLSHPNIAAIYDTGRHNGRPYIAMQLIDGRTLKAARPELRTLVGLVRDAARGLHHAHTHGVIHRDVKPENLMVSDARLFILDFGLARQTSVESGLSASGIAMGTPAYMSPEQARGDSKSADARSDVYSLGATLYELLAGRPPFEGRDLFDVLVRVVEEEPLLLRRRDPAIDRDLETLTAKCLEKDPARRYPSALALAEDLERWLADEPVVARPVSTLERLFRRVKRQRAMTASLVAIVLIALAAAAALLVQRGGAARADEEQKQLAALWVDVLQRKRDLRTLTVPLESARPAMEAVVAEVDEFARRHPASPQTWYVAARARLYAGRIDGAEQAARRSAELAPGIAMPRRLLGTILLERTQDYLVWNSPEDKEQVENRQQQFITAATAEFNAASAAAEAEWGLGRSAEDEIMETVAIALQLALVKKDLKGIQMLHDAVKRRKAEEYAVWLASTAGGAESERWLTEAITWAPGLASAWQFRGILRRNRKAFTDALSDFNESIRLDPANAQAHFGRAQARQAVGDLAGALLDVGETLRLQPENLSARRLRAYLLHMTGNYDAAVAAFDELARGDPSNGRHVMDRGLAHLRACRYALAAADLAEVVRRDPANQAAHEMLGVALGESGDRTGALKSLDEAVRLDPEDAGARINRARFRLAAGDRAGALADSDAAVRIRPDRETFGARGCMRRKLGDAHGAVSDLNEAIRLGDRSVETLHDRAIARDDAGDVEGAVADYCEVLRQEPAHSRALFNRGGALHLLGRLEEAERDYTALLRLKPGDWEGWLSRGTVRMGLAQRLRGGAKREGLEASLVDFSEAIRLKPEVAGAYSNRGLARAGLGDVAGAIKDYDEALRLDPNLQMAYLNRGQSRRNAGDVEGALSDFDEAVKRKPTDAVALANRGFLRKEKGETKGAIRDLEEALKAAPAAWPFRAEIEKALAEMKR